GNPQQKEHKEKGVINSGCSRHMIRNKCHLTDYEDYKVDLFFLVMVKVEYLEKAEAVNTACYVLNRALVIKPHNKTPYELIRGIPPLIDFMKPFGCRVTILNTRDYLGKFDEKADEGLFVGYSVTRLAFDIDSLTISMNYVSVVTGFQTNGIAGTKDNIVAGQAEKKKEPEQEYILIPICTNDSLISQGPKDSVVDAGKKATEVDESQVSDNDGQNDQVTRSELEELLQQERQTEQINGTNSFSTVSSPVNTARPSFVNAAGTPASTYAFEEHPFERFYPFKNAFSIPHVPIVTLINDT
nr:ribonuclease H-like domain-containing protein [Tanacetum cinerariifolium]